MKSLFGVLSLVLVLVYSQAEEPTVCDKTLGPEELHKVHGDWVLVFAVYDKVKGYVEMPYTNSSHMEVHVQPDNHTLVVHEHNVYAGSKCLSFTFNLTLPQSHEGHNRLDFVGGTETRNEEVKPYAEKATAEFFPTSDNSIEMVYKSEIYGSVYLVFRREGQHVDDLEKDHEEHRAMAKCLNLHGEHFVEWHYELADFCHKKSVLPTLDSDELHQVDGDWVMDWMAYKKITNQDDPWMNLTSSYMEIHVQPDNHTVVFHERNVMGGKCVSYKENLTLPQSSERIHRLHMEGGMENTDGEWKPYNDNVTVEFFPSSANTMEMFYRSETQGDFLIMYRRFGHHTDVKDLQKEHEEHKAKAKYFGLTGTKNSIEWHYDGVADFCHKKSVLPTLDSDELHQVDGDWVMVLMAYKKITNQDDPWMNLTSSYMEMRVQPDNHTVVFHERNIMGGKCVSYKENLTLPQSSERIHRLHMEGGMENTDGEWKPYNDTVTVGFFPSSTNTMEMFYKSEAQGDFLMMYRRFGHHTDMKDLQKEHEEHKAKAKYFGLTGRKNSVEWHYDGVADFCHPKPTLEKAES